MTPLSSSTVLVSLISPSYARFAQVPRVKYTFWNHDFSLVAMATKHTIVIATKLLDQL